MPLNKDEFMQAFEEGARILGVEMPTPGQNGKGGPASPGPAPAQPGPAPAQGPGPTPGVPAPGRILSSDRIDALRKLGYTFRLNEADDSIEVNGIHISDPLRAEMHSKMRDKGFAGTEALEDAYTAEAYANRYHPVKDYLNGLKWDGEPHITALAAYFTNPDGALPTWLRRWLVGSVAKVFDAEQNPVIVLDGPQNIGKSTFALWLCPLPEYHIESEIRVEDKDSEVRLMSKWIWEVGELGSTMRRSDREALKFFISKRTVTVRKAYGRYDTVKPAMASLIGTVNNEGGILSDPTGSRRFLVARVEKIDWDYSDLDVEQVWAEAYHAYRLGESAQLTGAENELRKQINEAYEIEDPLEGLVLKFFGVDPKNVNAWTSTTSMLATLETNGLRGNLIANSRALAGTMKRLGAERARRWIGNNKVWGYQGVESLVARTL